MSSIWQAVIVGIVFYFVYKVIEVLARRRERNNFVEKLGSVDLSKNSTVDYAAIFGNRDNMKYWPLRFGGLIIGMGLGLLVGYLIIYSIGFDIVDAYRGDQVGIIYGASTLLFGGIGLVTVFLIEKNIRKSDSHETK